MSFTIHDVAEAIRRGEKTPVQVVEECFQQVDRLEGSIRAWVMLDRDEAYRQAHSLTEELRHGNYRGPLHGIPMGVKDIFDVQGWPTAAGSQRWKNKIAAKDSNAVALLRKSGVIFLGKTVTTPYALFDPPVTRNPWNRERTPGGSSSGSAAAVASGMCLAALASQTGGSIIRPASYCGVYGLKPTYDRIAIQGVFPLAPSLDHVGVIGRCVQDLAILFDPLREGPPTLLSDRIDWEPAEIKIAVPDRFFLEKVDATIQAHYQNVLQQLSAAGAKVSTVALPSQFDEILTKHRKIMTTEAAAIHEQDLQSNPQDYPPKMTSFLQEGFQVRGCDYVRAKQVQKELQATLETMMQPSEMIWLVPATTSVAPDASSTGDPSMQSPWSFLGFPVVSFPVGWSEEGLPVGLQMVGSPYCEFELLQLAHWCEKVMAFQKRPIPIE